MPEEVVSEGPKKRRFKQPAGKFTSPKPSRKSSRLASLSRPRPSKLQEVPNRSLSWLRTLFPPQIALLFMPQRFLLRTKPFLNPLSLPVTKLLLNLNPSLLYLTPKLHPKPSLPNLHSKLLPKEKSRPNKSPNKDLLNPLPKGPKSLPLLTPHWLNFQNAVWFWRNPN